MKIDYEQIKRFLSAFESSETPLFNTINIFTTLGYNEKNNEDSKQVLFYMNLLKDQGLIECISNNNADKDNLGFSYSGNQIDIKILNFRLTILGHQTLESMSNNKLWDKIKGPLSKLGIESLKQIPSLAIQLLSSATDK